MRRVITALLLTCAWVGGAAAQDGSLNVFLWEKSYAAVRSPDVIGAPTYYGAIAEPDLLSEAQLGVHLPLRRGLNVQELRDGEGFGVNVFLTPQFRLRGLDVESGPVRSISFMPKFTGQLLWSRGGDGMGSAGMRHVFGANLILGHHSNGGSTCEFEDETHDADGTCVSSLSPVPPASQREIRVNGGNFSTNYIEVGGGYRIGETDSRLTDHWTWFAEVALSYQRHHDWFGFPLPGGPAPGFDDLYGLHRLRIDHQGFAHLPGCLGWLGLRWGLRADLFDPKLERFSRSRDYTLESELFLQFVDGLGYDGMPDVLGLGIRYSRGMDYYNTQFVRDISFFQIMVVVDPWSPRFR